MNKTEISRGMGYSNQNVRTVEVVWVFYGTTLLFVMQCQQNILSVLALDLFYTFKSHMR